MKIFDSNITSNLLLIIIIIYFLTILITVIITKLTCNCKCPELQKYENKFSQND
jgi:hypothetical protein